MVLRSCGLGASVPIGTEVFLLTVLFRMCECLALVETLNRGMGRRRQFFNPIVIPPSAMITWPRERGIRMTQFFALGRVYSSALP